MGTEGNNVMTELLFSATQTRSIPVVGETAEYPVHRIFCVGQNYAAHATEMGAVADPEAPFFFTKQSHAVVHSGATVPYPPGTSNYHFEMELAFTLGGPLFRCSESQAASAIYSYGCALDMTRRDLQAAAKEKRRPWDMGKDFEDSAVFGPMTKARDFGTVRDQRISLSVNGAIQQDGALSDMIHGCTDILCHLSQFYHLGPGDVVLTGTPAGVGSVSVGDELFGQVDGLAPVRLNIGPAE